jgi:hypothetical protein
VPSETFFGLRIPAYNRVWGDAGGSSEETTSIEGGTEDPGAIPGDDALGAENCDAQGAPVVASSPKVDAGRPGHGVDSSKYMAETLGSKTLPR